MKRSKRIERVSELGRNEERSAGRQLAQAKEAQSGKQQMLDQLLGFRGEYRELFEKQCAEGMDAQRLNNFRRFFNQLDRAIGEQERNLQAGEQQVEQHRAQWLQKRQDNEILARLTGRLQQQERREDQKQEQKQADEQFARRQKTS